MAAKPATWSGLRWAFTAFMGIMLLHSLAILLFTRGFLLTRSELPQSSQCEDIAESPCFPPHHDQNANKSCWTKPIVDRLVIIVLDALRLTAYPIISCSSIYLLVMFIFVCLWGILIAGLILLLRAHFFMVSAFSWIGVLFHCYPASWWAFSSTRTLLFRTSRLSSFVQLIRLKVFCFFFLEKKPWMDRLQVFHELAAQNKSSARIFKAIADPPTTSLQRLKVNICYYLSPSAICGLASYLCCLCNITLFNSYIA